MDAENRPAVTGGRGWWRGVKELGGAGWWLQCGLWDVGCSRGGTVNSVTVAVWGAQWVLRISRELLCAGHDCLASVLYI